MTWFKVDDKLHSHPKVELAGVAAMGLWVIAGSWSADQLTDGVVSVERISRLCGDRRQAHLLAKSLVRAGLWVEVEGGYKYHEWHEHQPTAEAVKAEKERKRRNVADHRARRNQAITGNVTGYTTGKESGLKSRPDPDPTRPDLKEKKSSTQAAPSLGLALVPSEPKKPGKPKAVAETHPQHGEVVDAYFAAFEAYRGTKPTFGARDGAAVKSLLAQCANNASRAIEVIRSAFTGEPWLADRATIALIAADPSKYLGKAKPSGTGLQRGLQKFVANGDYDGGGFVDT